MLVSFVTGTYDVAFQIFQTIFLTPADRQNVLAPLNADFLHTIALLIILMKAYRVLVEYMRWYHIDIKYMMEIGIIASILELLFNYQHYTTDMRFIFLGIAVSFSAIYTLKHDVLVKAMKESRSENLLWRNGCVQYDDLDAIEDEIVEEVLEEVKPKKKVVRKKATKKVSSKKKITK